MNVMLDLETWGTAPGCAIRSIGAVAFTFGGGAGDTFYANVSDESCIEAGLVREHNTVTWWMQQPPEASDVLLDGQVPLAEALQGLFTWFRTAGGEQVWAQGAAFDVPVIEHAMRLTGIKAPWQFWNVRDTRTVYDIAGLDYHKVPRAGVAHNALDDCLHQIGLVHEAMRMLGK